MGAERIISQEAAAMKAKTDAQASAPNQPKMCTKNGTAAVETAPPRFPAMFIKPPAVPACGPANLMTADQ